jgi:hypothetical protein
MPHQWSKLPIEENSTIPHDFNTLYTQQTTNSSASINNTNILHNTTYESSLPQTTPSPVINHTLDNSAYSSSTSHHQPTTLTTNTIFNKNYGCETVLSNAKSTCRTKAEYFKLLFQMYTGCEGSARNCINNLLDNKHSTVTIRSIKPVKKEYVMELFQRYSYLMLKERGVLGYHKKSFRPANKSQDELNTLFNSPHFRLPASEKLFIEFEMEPYLNHYENELQIRLDELHLLGSEISKSDLKK